MKMFKESIINRCINESINRMLREGLSHTNAKKTVYYNPYDRLVGRLRDYMEDNEVDDMLQNVYCGFEYDAENGGYPITIEAYVEPSRYGWSPEDSYPSYVESYEDESEDVQYMRASIESLRGGFYSKFKDILLDDLDKFLGEIEWSDEDIIR